jgi:hypothetical protein
MEGFYLTPSEREAEIEEEAGRIIAEFDRIAYEGLNRILEEVRRQGRIVSTPEEGSSTPPRA